MKKIFLLLSIVMLTLPTKAGLCDNLLVGIKGGINLPSMAYSQEPYSVYNQETFIRPLYSIFVEGDLTSNLSLRPEFMYIGRGVKINETVKIYGKDTDVDYEFAPNYFDFRLPFIWNFRMPSLTPYILLSPNFGFVVGGQTTRPQPIEPGVTEDDMNKGYINDFDFGVSFGAGVKFPIAISNFRFYLGAEGQYNLGLINNKPAETYGTRHNRGIEVALTLSIPICNGNNQTASNRGNDTVVIVRHDTIKIYQKDTIIVRQPVVLIDHDKNCYEIREILAYVDNEFNVRGKDICLYNITYDNNSASVDAASRRELDSIVSLLNKMPKMQMQVNGHADNRGAKDYNDKLSADRAKGVYDYIVSKGIDKNRLSYQGLGSTKPIADNATEEGRHLNRRVEFDIIGY